MRWAKSYSIVDHQLLHRGFFQSLSVEALALYLFLVVVSDREGKSYYATQTIADILRLSPQKFSIALGELLHSNLITHRLPNFWVNNLTTPQAQTNQRADLKPPEILENKTWDKEFQKEQLKKLLEHLSTKARTSHHENTPEG